MKNDIKKLITQAENAARVARVANADFNAAYLAYTDRPADAVYVAYVGRAEDATAYAAYAARIARDACERFSEILEVE